MDDIRRLAFDHVRALNHNDPGEAARVMELAIALGLDNLVKREALKIRAHTGDLLANWELRGIRDKESC